MKKLAIASALAVIVSTPALAQDYHHQIGAGWLHINPQESSDPMKTTLANGTVITSQGTDATLSDENTLGLTYTYFVDDHVGIQFVGGIPPKFELSGTGQSTLGDLGSFDKLATTKLVSPTLLGIYTFGAPSQMVRPYVGLGVTYTRFSDIKLDPGFEASAQGRGRLLIAQAAIAQGATPAQAQAIAAATPVSVKAEADDAIDPTVVLGLDVKFNQNWYAQASVSYLPLETTASIIVSTPSGTLATADAHMDINPIVGYLGVGYRF